MNQVQCPACRNAFQYSPNSAGQLVNCPTCQTTLQLPGVSQPAPQQQPVQQQPVQQQLVQQQPMQQQPMQQQPMQQQPMQQQPRPQSNYANKAGRTPNPGAFKKKSKLLSNLMVWGGMATGAAVLIVVVVYFVNGGQNLDTGATVKKPNSDSALTNVRESKKKSDAGFEKLRVLGQKPHREAVALFQEALALDSKNADAYVGLGNARTQANMGAKPAEILEMRIEDYSTALKIDREHAAAYGARAECFLNKEEFDLALSDIQNALKFGAGHPHFNGWKSLQNRIEIERRVAPSRFNADKILK